MTLQPEADGHQMRINSAHSKSVASNSRRMAIGRLRSWPGLSASISCPQSAVPTLCPAPAGWTLPQPATGGTSQWSATADLRAVDLVFSQRLKEVGLIMDRWI